MKILLFDKPFPTSTAQWRIEEVKSFITEKGADVLTANNRACEYDTMRDYYNLEDYNILISNWRYNDLNKYNNNFDGVVFNGKFPGDFVVSKHRKFDISKYDIIYHIFYSRWKKFNELYPNIPQNKQIIHFYPGGKFNIGLIDSIPKDVNIITTQRYYTEFFQKGGYKPKEILGASFLQKNDTYNLRTKNKGKLIVCLSAATGKNGKGIEAYEMCVDLYKNLYKNDNIEFIFIGIGNDIKSNNIIKYPLMSMENLKKKLDKVDIYVNPESGRFTNGWPLGVEAMLRGSVLITTDPFNSAQYYPYTNDLIIIKTIDEIIKHIKQLYDNRDLLKETSNRLQKNVNEFYSFNNQQQLIFDYIDGVYKKNIV